MQSDDIRANKRPMTKENARYILKTHWIATGKTQNMNDDQMDHFFNFFPSVDLRLGLTENGIFGPFFQFWIFFSGPESYHSNLAIAFIVDYL